MKHSSLRIGVAGSLVLHALVGVWLAVEANRPQPQVQRPGEIWFEDLPPPPPPKAPEAKQEPTPPRTRSPVKTAVRQPVPETGDTSSSPPPPSSSDSPRADTPRAMTLFPEKIVTSEGGTIAVEPSRGETVHPDDPRFDPDVIAAKEKQRVKGRVEGWTEDLLADARAQNGLPHPYLTSVGAAGRAGLDKRAREEGLRASPELAGRVLAERLQGATEEYGKSGNPNLGPPGQAPRLSEKITQPDQQALKALAQATELYADLTHNKPLLTLTLELRQSKTNQTKTTILKASIDPAFDAFVLKAWPPSIAAAGPPPADAFRSSELRSIWEIEGWPGATPFDKTMSYLPETGVMGVPLTRLVPAAVKGVSYEFRAKLLRVY